MFRSERKCGFFHRATSKGCFGSVAAYDGLVRDFASATCYAALIGLIRPGADAPKLPQVTGSQAMTVNSETRGRIVKTYKDRLPILWTYVPEMPEESSRRALPWLTVVRWEYDGSGNNGMPRTGENQRMLMLEAALLKIERPEICVEAYRRIGAGIREFVYYIVDRERFLEEFNEYVAGDSRYPIEIKFYKDEDWSELQELINDLN